jgi:hypothetical protein
MMRRSPSVSSPSAVLPLEARQAAWDALWRRLLAEPPRDDDPEHNDSDDEEQANEAA